MTVIHHAFDAGCTPAQLWAVLADMTAVANYNPVVATARMRPGPGSGIGATRACDLRPKGAVTERAFVWDEGKALGIEVIESDWPMRDMRWVTRIEARGSASRVTQTLEYRMKFGLLGALLNALVVKRTLNRNVGATLQAFIAYAERGK